MGISFSWEETYQPDSDEMNWIVRTVRKKNRLILAVMLKHFQETHTFPENIEHISTAIIACLSYILGISSDYLKEFDWHSQMAWRYRRAIRNYLGFRKNTTADMEAFSVWLTANILDGAPSVKQCIAHADG